MKVNTERLTAKQVKMITEETRRQIAENLAVLSKEIEATYFIEVIKMRKILFRYDNPELIPKEKKMKMYIQPAEISFYDEEEK